MPYRFSGSGGAQSFSDPLTAADANGFLDGTKWIFAITPPAPTSNSINAPTYSIGVSSKDAVKALQWSYVGVANPAVDCRGFLIPVTTYSTLWGKIQFVQLTNVQTVSNNGLLRAGGAVLANPAIAGYTAYVFMVESDAHAWKLIRSSIDVPATLASGGATADGDIFRVSGDPSVPGQVTITVQKNGVVLTQYVDTNAARLTVGSPMATCWLNTRGVSDPKSEWRNFSCGAGL